jgi:hypothetical protein
MTSLSEENQRDIICYLLKSDTPFNFNQNEVFSMLPEELKIIENGRYKVEFNTVIFDEDTLKIEFLDIGNRIIVSD